MRNNYKKNTFSTDFEGLVETVNFNKYRIAFKNWTGITKLQIGNTQIKSPLIESTPITPLDIDVNLESADFPLDIDKVTNTLAAICTQYNSSLDDIIPPLVQLYKEGGSYHDWWKWLLLTIGLIVAATLIITISNLKLET